MELGGKRILVVGGAGFIGSHVVDALLRADVAEVVVYENFCRGVMENLNGALQDPRCRIFPHGGDILHTDTLRQAMEGVDGVFHLAALWLLHCHDYPRSAYKVNVEGTFNVIEAAIQCGVRRIVYSSSASVYGDAVRTPMDEDHPYNNDTFYGATKIAGEHFFKSLAKRYGFEWIGLRYMNVYGPRQDYLGAYTVVIHKVLDRIEQGKPPIVFGDGSQQYDFIAASDVARCNVLGMSADTSGDCYNVGRGIGTSIRELTELLLEITGADLDIEYRPEGRTFVTNRVGDPEKAFRDLGFRWSVGLREGLEEVIQWRRADRARLAVAAT